MGNKYNINNIDVDLLTEDIFIDAPKFQKNKRKKRFDDGTSLRNNTKKRKTKRK